MLYYFQGYAANSAGSGYTKVATFTTVTAAPVAGAATNVGASGFIANWSAATGPAAITGYQFDVSANSAFTSMLRGFSKLAVSGTSQAVPADLLTPGQTYYYRVRAVNAGGTSANSSTVTVPYMPISVTSPNGGESWSAEGQVNITWSYWGSAGSKVKIELVKGSSTVATIASSVSIGSNGTGSCPWTVPTTLVSGSDYKVRVTSTSNSSLTAMSQGAFTIKGGISITVTSPAGGETWATGSKQTITWSYQGNPGSTVNIVLLSKGKTVSTIKSAVSIGSGGNGSYAWTMPKVSSGGSYQVQVTSTANSLCTSISNNFTITAGKTSAGPDQEVSKQASVKLSGSNSTGIDMQGATCRWTQLDGPPVTIANPSAIETGFVAPQGGPEGKSLRFQLAVTSADGTSSQDECMVNVIEGSAPPKADAGPTQVAASQIVELDGSGSSASDGGTLAYFWRQVSGIAVNLSDPSSAKPTFVATDAAASGESLAFELTVTDSAGLRSRDTCIVNVVSNDVPPKAEAGFNRTVSPGSRVVLDGSGSMDEDGGMLSYAWKQIAGVPVTLSDPAAVKPVFVAPTIGGQRDLVFELTVTNAAGLQDKAKVVIEVFGVSN
jgi:hypothetical protein